MLNHLLRNFSRLITLHTSGVTGLTNTSFTTCRILHVPITHCGSLIRTVAYVPDTLKDDGNEQEIVNATNLTDLSKDTDGSSIAPYCIDDEKPRRNVLVEALRTRYRLSDKDVNYILTHEVVSRTYRHRSLVHTLNLLCIEGVTKQSFLDYPWLLTLDKARLLDKLALLHKLHMRDINDFVPFLRLSLPRLRKLVSNMSIEAGAVPNRNRLYYISEMLNTDPKLVAKYLSKRLFILELPYDMLEKNLQHMIKYNVCSKNILKDLWAFRYTPKSVELRLERAKRAKKNKIMPWMVRCPESILQRSLKLSIDEIEVLGDKSVIEYVADRIGFDVESTKCIMQRHPAVMHVRVTKIKEVLDYLLNEAGFSRYDIANVPRILCHSLETTKQRLEELKSYGCRPSSLVILCRSKREYEKFVKSWIESSMKMRQRPGND